MPVVSRRRGKNLYTTIPDVGFVREFTLGLCYERVVDIAELTVAVDFVDGASQINATTFVASLDPYHDGFKEISAPVRTRSELVGPVLG